MKDKLYKKYIEKIIYQNNVFSILTILLVITVLCLSYFLYIKKERIVVVPPIVEKEFWIDEKNVSATYIEQMTLFLSQQLLNKSFQSSALQKNIVLRHTMPNFIGTLKKKLIEEERFLKEQNMSYIFYPAQINIIPKELKGILIGDRITYLGANKSSEKKEKYEFIFAYQGGRLLLQELRKIGGGNEKK